MTLGQLVSGFIVSVVALFVVLYITGREDK